MDFPHPPPFDGTNPEKWLIEFCAGANGWSTRAKDYLIRTVGNTTPDSFSTIPGGNGGDKIKVAKWRHIRECFILEFESPDSGVKSVGIKRKKGESLASYATKFREVAHGPTHDARFIVTCSIRSLCRQKWHDVNFLATDQILFHGGRKCSQIFGWKKRRTVFKQGGSYVQVSTTTQAHNPHLHNSARPITAQSSSTGGIRSHEIVGREKCGRHDTPRQEAPPVKAPKRQPRKILPVPMSTPAIVGSATENLPQPNPAMLSIVVGQTPTSAPASTPSAQAHNAETSDSAPIAQQSETPQDRPSDAVIKPNAEQIHSQQDISLNDEPADHAQVMPSNNQHVHTPAPPQPTDEAEKTMLPSNLIIRSIPTEKKSELRDEALQAEGDCEARVKDPPAFHSHGRPPMTRPLHIRNISTTTPGH